jgi:hypothetical protein
MIDQAPNLAVAVVLIVIGVAGHPAYRRVLDRNEQGPLH